MNGTVLYFVQDQLGSTRALLDGSGTTVARFTYDVYGTLTSSTGRVSTPFDYAGQYTDSESGMQYLRARYYDPATQQFLTVDPLAATTRTPYVYATGNPMNRVDQTGLYDYQYDEGIGTVEGTGGAAAVMKYLQDHLSEMFPFSTGECTHVVMGATCLFVPLDLLVYKVYDPLSVTAKKSTCFTLSTSLDNRDIGPGGSITFSTYEMDGYVYLRETAHAPNATWYANIGAPPIAKDTWFTLATNLRRALGASDASDYAVIGG